MSKIDNDVVEHAKAFYFMLNVCLYTMDTFSTTPLFKQKLKNSIKSTEELLTKELYMAMKEFYDEDEETADKLLKQLEGIAEIVGKCHLNDIEAIKEGLDNYVKQKEEIYG
jgi:hypothetical protein